MILEHARAQRGQRAHLDPLRARGVVAALHVRQRARGKIEVKSMRDRAFAQ